MEEFNLNLDWLKSKTHPMMPSPRKPKVSLLGWMSFSLRVWLEVTRSMPVLGLAGLARVGLSSRPDTAAELFLTE